jgi:hypothetical protein
MKKLRLLKTLPKRYNFLNETGKNYGDWKVIRYALITKSIDFPITMGITKLEMFGGRCRGKMH